MLFASLIALQPARAAAVTIRLGDTPAPTLPGRALSLSWMVINETESSQGVREELTLPEGWQVINAEPLGQLPAHGSALRLTAIRVPQRAAAGNYAISCAWSDAAHAASNPPFQRAEIKIVVLARHEIGIVPQTSPELAISGDTYSVTALAVNRGNAAVKIHGSAAISPLSKVALDPADFTLVPGASRMLQVKVSLPEKLDKRQTAALEITLTPDSGPAVNTTVLTDIVPRESQKPNSQMVERIETTVVRESDGTTDWRAELDGSTALDDAGTKNLSYVLRGPDTKASPLFLEPGQFSANYTAPGLKVQAGDQTYALSPLTAVAQLDRGAGFDSVESGSLRVGAFASHARYSEEDADMAGAYVGYQPNSDFSVRLNTLVKEIGPLQTFAGDRAGVVSLETNYNYSSFAHGELELGYSPWRPAGTSAGQPLASRVSVAGEQKGKWSYKATWEDCGASYFGAMRDAQVGQAAVEWSPASHWSIRSQAQLANYSDPYSLPMQQLLSNRESGESAGIVVRQVAGLDLSVDAQTADRDFAFVSMPTHYLEKTLHYGIGRTRQNFGAQAYVEQGELHANQPTNHQAPIQRAGVSAYVQPSSHLNASVYATEGNDPYSATAARTKTVGSSISARVGKVGVTVQTGENIYDATLATRRSYAFGRVAYSLPHHQEVAVRFGWQDPVGGTSGGTSVGLSYSITFSHPRPRLGHQGGIKGEICSAETGAPLHRVVVFCGDEVAVSDPKGHFEMTGLAAGNYQLRLDARSLPEGRLSVQNLPMAVTLAHNETKQLRLPLARAGAVNFQLQVTSDQAAAPMIEAVVVEISSGGHTLRQLTDNTGRAFFPQVLPGDWSVRVDPTTLPTHYHLNEEISLIHVAPAQNRDVSFALLYQAPTVRWLAISG